MYGQDTEIILNMSKTRNKNHFIYILILLEEKIFTINKFILKMIQELPTDRQNNQRVKIWIAPWKQ